MVTTASLCDDLKERFGGNWIYTDDTIEGKLDSFEYIDLLAILRDFLRSIGDDLVFSMFSLHLKNSPDWYEVYQINSNGYIEKVFLIINEDKEVNLEINVR